MTDAKSQPAALRGINLPVYPKSFFSAQKFSKERERIFVIMPFRAPHSDALWEVMNGVCSARRLNLRRGDVPNLPSLIITDILAEIEEAEIIIADLTGLNPNVLYETGIAHVRCESVILVAQAGQALPFDLEPFRCIFFDLSSEADTKAFQDQLGRAIEALRDVGRPVLIDSSLRRTELIVNDLHELFHLRENDSYSQAVLTSSSLSAFAISPEETFRPGDESYRMALLEEKQALLDLAYNGCPIKCIITPPYKDSSLQTILPQHTIDRMHCLLEFLKSDDMALNFIVWAVSPFRQKNLYIIDHISYIEGFKEATGRGFGLSLRQTNRSALVSNIEVYEALFDRMSSYTIDQYYQGEKPAVVQNHHLRQATINCVEGAIASWR